MREAVGPELEMNAEESTSFRRCRELHQAHAETSILRFQPGCVLEQGSNLPPDWKGGKGGSAESAS